MLVDHKNTLIIISDFNLTQLILYFILYFYGDFILQIIDVIFYYVNKNEIFNFEFYDNHDIG